MAVLHSASFTDLEHLRRVHEEMPVPSLIVVDSLDEEDRVFQWPALPLTVDVCRSEALRGQLSVRLRRLVDAMGRDFEGWLNIGASRNLPKALHNREYLDLRLAREFSNARKHCRSLTIAWLELADLGRISKTFGPAAANRVLRSFAETAVANIRIVDWLAHYGNQEFCLVMPDTWLNEGRQVAERLKKTLSLLQVQIDDQHTLTPRTNVGVVELTDDENDHEDLIQKAAEAALMGIIAEYPLPSAGQIKTENRPLKEILRAEN